MKARLVALFLFFQSCTAFALPLDFEVTLFEPLTYAGDTIGGPASPVQFSFTFDSDTPGFGTPTYVNYSTGACDGNVVVHVGSELADLACGPIIAVEATGAQSSWAFFASSLPPPPLLHGRDLLYASIIIGDFTGRMLTTTALPLDFAFVANSSTISVELVFDPLSTDPEFGTGGLVHYVNYSLRPSDLNFRPAGSLPEPSGLVFVGLIVLMFSRGSFRHAAVAARSIIARAVRRTR